MLAPRIDGTDGVGKSNYGGTCSGNSTVLVEFLISHIEINKEMLSTLKLKFFNCEYV